MYDHLILSDLDLVSRKLWIIKFDLPILHENDFVQTWSGHYKFRNNQLQNV